MASWFLAPALVDLRAELNELNPDRDKASDGTIGDIAHQQTPSKHNPNSAGVVRAFDCDNTGPWPGTTFTTIVNFIVARQKSGADDRLQNVIWNRRIASRSWGWTWQNYDGPSPHTEHAHFEVRDSSTWWNKRGPYGLVEEFGMLNDDDKAWLASLIGPTTKGVRAALLDDPALIANPVRDLLAGNRDLLADGVRELLWDATHAKRVEALAEDGVTTIYKTGVDPVYDAAPEQRRKEMRNTLQLMQELGMVPRLAPTPPQG